MSWQPLFSVSDSIKVSFEISISVQICLSTIISRSYAARNICNSSFAIRFSFIKSLTRVAKWLFCVITVRVGDFASPTWITITYGTPRLSTVLGRGLSAVARQIAAYQIQHPRAAVFVCKDKDGQTAFHGWSPSSSRAPIVDPRNISY